MGIGILGTGGCATCSVGLVAGKRSWICNVGLVGWTETWDFLLLLADFKDTSRLRHVYAPRPVVFARNTFKQTSLSLS